jgi:hypothetical protein
VQRCSNIILAFPPTLSALKSAALTLSPEEETLFGQVGVHNYFSSAVRMTQVPSNVSFLAKKPSPITPVEPDGQPVYFQPLHPNSGIVNVWSWDKYRKQPDEKRARGLLLETLSKFNKDPHNVQQASDPVTEMDVIGWSGVLDYFPHVDSEALRDGWYDKFNKLQGSQQTYYASGLNGFEIVEFAIRAGQDMATYL